MASFSEPATRETYQFQPLEDPRWVEFLDRHPDASIFHTVEWLKALSLTYGYEPRVLTTSPPGADLYSGIVSCRVDSWLTGRRLVSVPSADHCEPLVSGTADMNALLSGMADRLINERLAYMDFRSAQEINFSTSLVRSTNAYCFHKLDLAPDLTTLFSNCHKSSTQRKIRRAQKEGLTDSCGRSESLLNAFLRLYAITRRRHQIPPQPIKWFRNLIECFGEKLNIRVACKDGEPVAAILTIRYKDTLVYKYGCSDVRYNNLGGTHLLFWKMIVEGRDEGLKSLDLGRSDLDDAGLIQFKDRWGAAKSVLTYSRFAVSRKSDVAHQWSSPVWRQRLNRLVLSRLSDPALYLVGSLLYRHVG